MSALIPQILLVASSAALIVAACPPVGATWTLWISLLPALWVLARVSPARAALLGTMHGTLYSAFVTWWLFPTLRHYFDQGPLRTSLFLAGFWFATGGVFLAAWFGFLAQLRVRLGAAACTALAPAAWVAIELLRSHVGVRSPWAKLGDALYPHEQLRQLASAAGVYSLSALVVLGNVALFELARLRRGGSPMRSAASAALFALCVSAAWSYGEHRLQRLNQAAEQPQTLEIAAIQAGVASELTWKRSTAARVFGRYAELSREALREGRVDLVIWPEQALQTSPDDAQLALGLNLLLEELATPLLIGAVRNGAGPQGDAAFNSAFLMRPGGRERLHYDKLRLLPFSETQPIGSWLHFREHGDLAELRYAPGSEPGVFEWEGPTLGVSICFEATYPATTRLLARHGARVLVNLANDSWFRGAGGDEQHLAQVRFRALETGLPLVRVATSGISAVVLPDGRVAAELASGRSGVLRAAVPVSATEPTLYTRSGDAFAGLCATAAAIGALAAAWRTRRAARAQQLAATPSARPEPAAGHAAVTTL